MDRSSTSIPVSGANDAALYLSLSSLVPNKGTKETSSDASSPAKDVTSTPSKDATPSLVARNPASRLAITINSRSNGMPSLIGLYPIFSSFPI